MSNPTEEYKSNDVVELHGLPDELELNGQVVTVVRLYARWPMANDVIWMYQVRLLNGMTCTVDSTNMRKKPLPADFKVVTAWANCGWQPSYRDTK